MNSSPAPSPRVIALLRSPALRLVVAAFLAVPVASCSSKNKEPKPKKPKKHRDPVEQKVFYDGWWPERW